MSQIAEAHGTSVEALAQSNQIENPDHIEAGQELNLATSEAKGEAADKGDGEGVQDSSEGNEGKGDNEGGEHSIAEGETLSQIAQDSNTTVEALAESNDISNPDHIEAGDTISVPEGDKGNSNEEEGAGVAAGDGGGDGDDSGGTNVTIGGDGDSSTMAGNVEGGVDVTIGGDGDSSTVAGNIEGGVSLSGGDSAGDGGGSSYP